MWSSPYVIQPTCVCVCATLAMSLSPCVIAGPPLLRDSVIVGARSFVRTQVQANSQPQGATTAVTLAAGADGCLACFVRRNSQQPRYIRASQFGYWGDLLADVDIDPVASEQATTVGCGRGPVNDWIVWHVQSTWGRRLDDEGVFVGDTFPVNDTHRMAGNGDNIRLAFFGDLAHVVLNTGDPASDIYARVFDGGGSPQLT